MNRLAFQRKRKGISQEELGKKLGVPKTNISAWENGSRNIPVKHLDKLCQILKITEFELQNESILTFYRKRAGLTIEKLAKALGVPAYLVADWETYRQPFDIDYTEKLAEVLHLKESEDLNIVSDSVFTPELKRVTELK